MNRHSTRLFAAPISLVLLLITLAVGCAFEPGEPWGFVEATILLDDEHLEAPTALTVQSVQLTAAALRLYSSTPNAGGAKFDPANPPPGYSLCHGGHCHAADGTLPTYAEIEASLAGNSSAQNLAATARFKENLSDTHALESELKILQRGAISSAEIEFTKLHIEAIAQIADETHSLTINVPLPSAQLTGATDLHIDQDSPHHQTLELTVELPHELLASIDLDTLAQRPDGAFVIDEKNNAELAAIIADSFAANAKVSVSDDHDHDHDDH